MLQAGNQHTKPSIWVHQPILTPERKVWRAVLTQAIDDAELALDGSEFGAETAAEPSAASRARDYLRADNLQEAEHLKLVCDFADVPMDRVVLWARRRYPLAA